MEKLTILRGSRGISQKKLAEDLGVTRQTIINLETGKSGGNKEIEKKLCEYFNVSIYKLKGLDILSERPESREDIVYLINLLNKELEKWD